ncbi:TlpA family protein disulfide reductase [Aquabacterium humicola]|uniref:TlpA family protein disulfide reductase n=1 Tax=Aquabacterium humicola TaxID=3237377 RepID=UPI002543AC96|nr:TlpA disulfide reductase family protein [Rubrivivax pictus]
MSCSPARRHGLRTALALAAIASTGGALAAEPRAPALPLRTAAGEPILPPDDGVAPRWKVLYLDFWASWCGPCRQSFPWMNELHERHRAAGLAIVAINLDARREDAQDFLDRLPPRFAIAFDPGGASAAAFGVKAMPSSFLVGPDRRVLHAHRGFRPADRADLERRIAAALA